MEMYDLLVMVFVLPNIVIQAVRVIGGSVTVVQGETAVLPCLLIETTESLTQITWQRRTRQIQTNTNFYTILSTNGPFYFNGHDERFSFVGNISAANGSLQLSNVTMSDEGIYTCIYTLFPSGNFKTEIPLKVLVPPKTEMKDNFLTVGNEEVVLATCTAAHSWPSANVSWHLGNLADTLKITQSTIDNTDGTTTTVSTLSGAPKRNLHNHSVQCVIKSPALPHGTALPLTIKLHFPPSQVRIHESAKNSFECLSEANPSANFTWSRIGSPWPDSAVNATGPVLQILKPSSQLNGLFECKATNTFGSSQGQLYLHLSSEGTSTAGWTFFCLLICANAVGAAVWFYRSNKKCSIPRFNRSTPPEEPEQVSEPLRTAHEPEAQV